MKFRLSLMTLAAFLQVASADANNTGIDADHFTLPPSKINIESCQKEALLLHPGEISTERMLHRHNNYMIEYEIQARDGSEWIVLCDLTIVKILRAQKLVDDAD